MKKSFLLLGIALIVAYPVAAKAVVMPTPSPTPPSSPPNPNAMMGPAAYNILGTALQLKGDAHSLLDQAAQKNLDVTAISNSIAGADALLEQAQKIAICNPIPASNMLREAVSMYEKAISDLNLLLG